MMRKPSLGVLPAVALLTLTVGSISGQGRERIAVMPVTGIPNDRGARLTLENSLVDVFVAMKRFDIVERAQLEKVIAEQQLSLTGMISDSAAVSIGKLLGTNYLILGSVTEATIVENPDNQGNRFYKGKVTASVRVVSTETAAIVGSLTESDYSHGALSAGDRVASDQLITTAANNLVMDTIQPKLWNLFPLEGYVIQIQGQKGEEVEALIDLGSDKGVRNGDKFIVFRQGESIKHPVTGQMIPGRIQELGEAEVKSVDIATSAVKIKTKGAIQVGDRIKAKERKKSLWKKL